MKKTIKKIFKKILRVTLLTVTFPFIILCYGVALYFKCCFDLIMDKPTEE